MSLFLLIAGTVLAQEDVSDIELLDITIAELVVALSEDEDEPEFTVLREALESVELLDVLADEDVDYMVFAPSDAAFESLEDLLGVDTETIFVLTDFTEAMLLYHVSEELYTLEELQDVESIPTLQGEDISVSFDNTEEIVVLDGYAFVVEGDIVVNNGVIHVIDEVLFPADEGDAADSGTDDETTDSNGSNDTTEAGSGEPCLVRTDEASSVRVRVGPGENRTAVTFLPAGEDLQVQGRTEVDGEVWYQLDVEEAAPGRAINEAWVPAENLDSTGDCETIADADAPPIVPIINQPPPQTGGDDGDNGADAPPADTTGLIRPAAGTWALNLAGTTNASCEGTGNVQIPTNEILDQTSFQESVSPSGDSFVLSGTPMTFIGDNTHQGQEQLDEFTGTLYITFSSSTQASGRFITSFTVDGIGCSATIVFTMSR
jgi:uncharacterized surface protein with fasciclin (FAS1) repeats